MHIGVAEGVRGQGESKWGVRRGALVWNRRQEQRSIVIFEAIDVSGSRIAAPIVISAHSHHGCVLSNGDREAEIIVIVGIGPLQFLQDSPSVSAANVAPKGEGGAILALIVEAGEWQASHE